MLMPTSMLTKITEGMVQISGGTIRRGSDANCPKERPAHRVTVDGFWVDRHTVTNAEFAEFVADTS
jgi:sulfatase modifying factor 1